MQYSNLAGQSCRLRRTSAALPSAVLAKDLQSAPDAPRDLRQRGRYQGASAEDQLSSIAALQLRLTELAPGSEQALGLIAQVGLTAANAEGTPIAIAQGKAVVCCARAGSLAPPLGTSIKTRSGLSNESFCDARIGLHKPFIFTTRWPPAQCMI